MLCNFTKNEDLLDWTNSNQIIPILIIYIYLISIHISYFL